MHFYEEFFKTILRFLIKNEDFSKKYNSMNSKAFKKNFYKICKFDINNLTVSV